MLIEILYTKLCLLNRWNPVKSRNIFPSVKLRTSRHVFLIFFGLLKKSTVSMVLCETKWRKLNPG